MNQETPRLVFCSLCTAGPGDDCRHWPSGEPMPHKFHGERIAAHAALVAKEKANAVARRILPAAVTLKHQGASVDDIARRLKVRRDVARAALYLAEHPVHVAVEPVDVPVPPSSADPRQLSFLS